MSSPFNVDTSGKGGDAKHVPSYSWGGDGRVGNAQGGDGQAGNIKVGAARKVDGGTFKATGQGGSAGTHLKGTATGGKGTGGDFTLD